MIRIGTAGWTIPRRVASTFPQTGTTLERYSALFDAVEINSSFYRAHRPATYSRWADSVPHGFRFAVKVPKTITHGLKLVGVEALLDEFLHSVEPLGPKLGPLLVQMPPSLTFDAAVAASFFTALRARFAGAVVCEPRHPRWFEPDADALLSSHQVARVAADPARVPSGALPGGWTELAYFRLHGSPRMYYSDYADDLLSGLSARLRASESGETWCMFDNTVLGAAADNALALRAMLAGSVASSS